MTKAKIFDILLTALISAAITILQNYLASLGHQPAIQANPETAFIMGAGVRTAIYFRYV